MENIPVIPMGNSRLLQIVMNCVPLLGVIYYDWSVFALLYAFWLETLGLSFLTAIRIMFAQKSNEQGPFVGKAIRFLFARTFILLFYLLFIVVFVGVQISGKQEGVNFMMYLVLLQPGFRITILLFFIIKVIELVYMYFYKNQRKITGPMDFHPFLESRIVVIHIVIVLGVFACQFFSEKLGNHSGIIAFASVFVLVKTIGDIVAYNFQMNPTKPTNEDD
ncbi:MAG: hypothetical protein RI922_1995 [Bacteroidota bacterium]|jgi:hypothetical protein